MLTGILLAAGRAGRMGKTKQLMPWPPPDGKTTIVAAAFDAIAPHVREMLVVLGHDADAIQHALGERTFTAVHSSPDAPMYESIRSGLTTAHTHNVLLHLADHPGIVAETIHALIDAARKYPGQAIIPTHNGKGGHPVLIPATIATRLIEYPGDGGLRQYWLDHPDQCRRVPVDDPGCIRDIDTLADYNAGLTSAPPDRP